MGITISKDEFYKIEEYIKFIVNNDNPCKGCYMEYSLCDGCDNQVAYDQARDKVAPNSEIMCIDAIRNYIANSVNASKYEKLEKEYRRKKNEATKNVKQYRDKFFVDNNL